MKRLVYLPAILMLTALTAVVLFPLSSCNTSGCTDNHSAMPQMGFYNSLSNAAVSLDSLELYGVGAPGDSMLIKSGERVQQLYFPLRFNSDFTQYCFHYDYKLQGLDNPAYNDTLSLWYTSEPYFASEECGALYIYHITGINYTRHLIDSVAVVDSIITNIDMERFRVYFRISEPTAPDEPDDENTDEDNENNEENTDEGNNALTGLMERGIKL